MYELKNALICKLMTGSLLCDVCLNRLLYFVCIEISNTKQLTDKMRHLISFMVFFGKRVPSIHKRTIDNAVNQNTNAFSFDCIYAHHIYKPAQQDRYTQRYHRVTCIQKTRKFQFNYTDDAINVCGERGHKETHNKLMKRAQRLLRISFAN